MRLPPLVLDHFRLVLYSSTTVRMEVAQPPAGGIQTGRPTDVLIIVDWLHSVNPHRAFNSNVFKGSQLY